MPFPVPIMVQQQPPQPSGDSAIPIPIPIFIAFRYLKYCRDIQDPTIDRVQNSEYESELVRMEGDKLDANEAGVKARALEMLGDYFNLALTFTPDEEEEVEDENHKCFPTPPVQVVAMPLDMQEMLDKLKKSE